MKIPINKSAINVLKKINRTEIKIYGIKSVSLKECEIEVLKKDEEEVNKLFKQKSNKKSKLYLFLTSILVCAFLCFCYQFSSNYIFKVIVNCNNEEISAIIQKEIKSQTGASIFSKNGVNLSKIKEKIMEHENVSLCSANFVGKTMVVNVKVSETIISEKTLDVVSKFEGTVESINVFSGTAKVKKGDFVKAGDVLISSQILINGEVKQISASGQVNILAYYQNKSIFTENKEVLNRTGNKTTKNCFTFKRSTDIINVETDKFKLYESEIKTQKIKIGGILPAYKTQIIFYELEKVKIFESFEENEDIILKEAMLIAKQKAGDKEFYAENAVATRLTNGVYEICATVQFLEKISVGENL